MLVNRKGFKVLRVIKMDLMITQRTLTRLKKRCCIILGICAYGSCNFIDHTQNSIQGEFYLVNIIN